MQKKKKKTESVLSRFIMAFIAVMFLCLFFYLLGGAEIPDEITFKRLR